MPEIVLASASPSRRGLLERSGLKIEVVVSGVDEEDPRYSQLSPSEMVVALAIVKAHTVRKLVNRPALIIACDSTFEFKGESLGKPLTRERAIERAELLSGNEGRLYTGHCLIDTNKEIEISDVVATKVHFAKMSSTEISSYVDTGEPLNVAGGFTLDGISAPFITKIEGETSNVIGLSLPWLRSAISSLGYDWFDFVTVKK
ncbi:MAG: septum formation inhibitor Maf [Actinobacteria bacterium]|nr:septum formation inhibitor Maf [Actinomycetota bacterium]